MHTVSKYQRQTRWGAAHMHTISARLTVAEWEGWQRALAVMGLGCTNAAIREYVRQITQTADNMSAWSH